MWGYVEWFWICLRDLKVMLFDFLEIVLIDVDWEWIGLVIYVDFGVFIVFVYKFLCKEWLF